MNSKTFGAVVGVVIALAVAMFVGLYMLGLSGQGHVESDAAYYEYKYLDDAYYYEDGDTFTEDEGFYFDDLSDYDPNSEVLPL